jgi:glycine cleavage system H protein
MRSLVGSTPALFRQDPLTMPDSFRGLIPLDRLYHPEHDMWVLPEDDGTIIIGATAYGIHRAGKIIGFTCKPKGACVETGRGMATIECAKTVIAVHAPIAFDLLEANETVEETPGLLNLDPYGAGWMARGQSHDWLRDMNVLLDGKHYRKHIRRADRLAEFL